MKPPILMLLMLSGCTVTVPEYPVADVRQLISDVGLMKPRGTFPAEYFDCTGKTTELSAFVVECVKGPQPLVDVKPGPDRCHRMGMAIHCPVEPGFVTFRGGVMSPVKPCSLATLTEELSVCPSS